MRQKFSWACLDFVTNHYNNINHIVTIINGITKIIYDTHDDDDYTPSKALKCDV